MIKPVFAIFIALLFCHSVQSQTSSNSGSVYSIGISPAHPTTHDSIEVPLKIVFANLPSTKWASDLTIYSDTILYQGCYYCGCLNLATSFVLDTIKIHPLAAGAYHLIILARYPTNFQDTICLNSNNAFTDTVDTFFNVTSATDVETCSSPPFNALMQRFNILQVNSSGAGILDVSIYDQLGKLICANNKIVLQEGNNVIKLQIPSLAPGFYFYEVLVGGERKILKFVKQ